MMITVREILVEDAEAVSLLSGQLGYPLSKDQILGNIKDVMQSKMHTAFVALHEKNIVGWIGAAQAMMIEVMQHCEINGLVIDEQYRGKGIGKLLIERVRQWANENGNDKLTVHCNTKRTQAHLFYEHMGFKEVKQQKYFELTFDHIKK